MCGVWGLGGGILDQGDAGERQQHLLAETMHAGSADCRPSSKCFDPGSMMHDELLFFVCVCVYVRVCRCVYMCVYVRTFSFSRGCIQNDQEWHV